VTAFERVLEAVERRGLRVRTCNAAQARAMVECPAHDDRRPSLSIRGADAKALLHCFAGCAPERVVEALGLEWRHCFDHDLTPGAAFDPGLRRNGRATVAQTGTTWEPADLGALLDGSELEQPPEWLRRSDGVALLYPGKIHTAFSEPEGCKGWVYLAAAAEFLASGEHVTLIDFEDTARVAVERLHALGVRDEVIRARLHYIRPEEPYDERGQHAIGPALAVSALVVLDGVTEALALDGIDMNSNVEVARWLASLPRRIAASGAAVVLLDHVVKDREARGRFAIGAQVKLSAADAAYRLEVVEPFARGRDGLVKVKVTKDRPGHIRRYAEGDRIADMRLFSDGSAVTVELDPPGEAGALLRPTGQMERVSRTLEQDPGLSKRAIRAAVSGRNDVIDLALELLIAEGYVEPRPDGRATAHRSLRPFREGEATGDRAHVPHRAPSVPEARSVATVPTCPPPIGGHGTRHGCEDALVDGSSCPDETERAEAELERLRAKGFA
jgi:hypothetical protein